MNLAPRSVEFRRQRERDWLELESMVERVLKKGLVSLGPEEIDHLPRLYRAALASLMVARETALDRELIRYLESLAARAYLAVYTSRRPTRGIFRTFLFESFPAAVRSMRWELLLTTAIFALGVAIASVLVHHEPGWYYAFMDAGMEAGRNPGSTTESLRDALYHSERSGLVVFSSFLFTHNAKIGLFAFALGIGAGVPTGLLVFSNGLSLGAFATLYASRGLFMPLLGWILPHGIPEITAVLLCGSAGLVMARAIVVPGRYRARDALAIAGRRAAVVAAGAVVLFAIAGLVEGIFRQLVTNDGIRFAMASVNAVWLFAWLVLAGRRRRA